MNGMSLQTALYMRRTFWESSFIDCMVDSLESCVSEMMKGLAPASSTLWIFPVSLGKAQKKVLEALFGRELLWAVFLAHCCQ